MLRVIVAEEIMNRELVTVSPEAKSTECIRLLLEKNISGAPVVDKSGQFLGVFSEKCSLNALTDILESDHQDTAPIPAAKDFMKTDLIRLTPQWDVFDSIDHLLSNQISGAPVVDSNNRFLGVFSEKTAMQVLLAAIFESVPGTTIEGYMNRDRNRVINAEAAITEVANRFRTTSYRRLIVLKDGNDALAGQISRRDVLRAELKTALGILSRYRSRPGSQGPLAETLVHEHMDRNALTVPPSKDLLGIAQLFLNSPYRRLPVVDSDNRLVGQISRRDLLATAAHLLKPQDDNPTAKPLYLSQVANDLPAKFS